MSDEAPVWPMLKSESWASWMSYVLCDMPCYCSQWCHHITNNQSQHLLRKWSETYLPERDSCFPSHTLLLSESRPSTNVGEDIHNDFDLLSESNLLVRMLCDVVQFTIFIFASWFLLPWRQGGMSLKWTLLIILTGSWSSRQKLQPPTKAACRHTLRTAKLLNAAIWWQIHCLVSELHIFHLAGVMS